MEERPTTDSLKENLLGFYDGIQHHPVTDQRLLIDLKEQERIFCCCVQDDDWFAEPLSRNWMSVLSVSSQTKSFFFSCNYSTGYPAGLE